MYAALLALLGFIQTHPNEMKTWQGLQLSMRGLYEESELVLKDLPANKKNDFYNFARLINNFALNQKEEALKYSTVLEDSFTYESMPRRHQVLAYIMSENLKTWKEADLGDI